ncbi:hypothetical protein DMENIID0001_027990 [Sergentomyia squamirostris]
MTIEMLEKVYLENNGEEIPFERYGFQTTEDFLRNLSDLVRVSGHGRSAVVTTVLSNDSRTQQHIEEMVDHQLQPAMSNVKPLSEVVVPQSVSQVSVNATDDEKADSAYRVWLYQGLLRNTSKPKTMLGYEHLFVEPDNLYDDKEDMD